jgi:hypothetical protein
VYLFLGIFEFIFTFCLATGDPDSMGSPTKTQFFTPGITDVDTLSIFLYQSLANRHPIHRTVKDDEILFYGDFGTHDF